MKGGDHHVEIFNQESVTAKADLKAASNSFVFYYLTTLLRGGALQMLQDITPGDGREAIIALDEAYASTGPEVISQTITEFTNLAFQDGEQYRREFNRIVKILSDNKVTFPDPYLRFKILDALPRSPTFSAFSEVQKRDPTCAKQSVKILLAAVIEEERYQRASAQSTISAYIVQQRNNTAVTGRTCTHCHKRNHEEETCWKKHPNLKPIRKTTTTNANVAKLEDESLIFGFNLLRKYSLLTKPTEWKL